MYSALNTTTEVPLSKAPNPQLLTGRRSMNGCRVCVHGVCVCSRCVCVHGVCVCALCGVCVHRSMNGCRVCVHGVCVCSLLCVCALCMG